MCISLAEGEYFAANDNYVYKVVEVVDGKYHSPIPRAWRIWQEEIQWSQNTRVHYTINKPTAPWCYFYEKAANAVLSADRMKQLHALEYAVLFCLIPKNTLYVYGTGCILGSKEKTARSILPEFAVPLRLYYRSGGIDVRGHFV